MDAKYNYPNCWGGRGQEAADLTFSCNFVKKFVRRPLLTVGGSHVKRRMDVADA